VDVLLVPPATVPLDALLEAGVPAGDTAAELVSGALAICALVPVADMLADVPPPPPPHAVRTNDKTRREG